MEGAEGVRVAGAEAGAGAGAEAGAAAGAGAEAAAAAAAAAGAAHVRGVPEGVARPAAAMEKSGAPTSRIIGGKVGDPTPSSHPNPNPNPFQP